jgi:hypothetical protein
MARLLTSSNPAKNRLSFLEEGIHPFLHIFRLEKKFVGIIVYWRRIMPVCPAMRGASRSGASPIKLLL